jgi:AcrR family transcriptional regulator
MRDVNHSAAGNFARTCYGPAPMARPRSTSQKVGARERPGRATVPQALVRSRPAPDFRRRQILDVASRLLGDRSSAALEIKEVAELVGVTRPVIYRLFPTRQALLEAVISDFEQELSLRFRDALLKSLGRPLPEVTVAFVEAACDAIEAKGSGPWRLFDARTSDLEAGRIGRAIHDRLLAPWIERIAEMTGRTENDVTTVSQIVVAAGRAALDGWLDGEVSRADAMRDATRAVSALLAAFAERSDRNVAPEVRARTTS